MSTDPWFSGDMVYIASEGVLRFSPVKPFVVDDILYQPEIRECYRRPMVQLIDDVTRGSAFEPCFVSRPPTEDELDLFVRFGHLPYPLEGMPYGLPTRRQ